MKLKNVGFDHVEWAVKNIPTHAQMYERMGFQKLGERKTLDRSVLYGQGQIRVLLKEPAKGSLSSEFLKTHGDGICVLALDVENARSTYEETVARGARSALEPVEYESEWGNVVRAEIYTPSDLRYAFVQRDLPRGNRGPSLFDDELVASRVDCESPFGLQRIDHLTNNVSIGEMKKWVEYYQRVFDFEVVRHFDISTGRTGLVSDVVRSRDGLITVPINEATEPKSQVQEFVERFKGPGVQHLALGTGDLISTLRQLRGKSFKFLGVPSAYYEMVPKRVPRFDEDLKELEELGILLDGEGAGYLLQIFSEEVVGPFFFEFIQRKGNQGFGEGNFRALFEAIERDQERRGVLKN